MKDESILFGIWVGLAAWGMSVIGPLLAFSMAFTGVAG